MSTGAMESGWYYSRLAGPPGQPSGPVTWEELVSAARGGRLAPDDLVWHEQLGDWRPASQIPNLFPVAAPTPAFVPAYAAVSAVPAAQPKRSSLLYWLIPAVVVVLVAAGLGLYFGLWYTSGTEAFVQGQGEILLEPSGVAGPDSFTGEQFVATGPTTTLKIPNPQVTLPPLTTTTAPATSSTQAASTTTASSAPTATVLVAYRGDTPALYGGSKSKVISDKDGELAYLRSNPQKAAAFCEALNSDATLRWSGGNKVSPSQLEAYFAELTPMLLTRDIRVTNYGYKNGHPAPRQSVLQAGQLILVDRYGVPRKRCECGNPLTPPIPSYTPPVYTGPRWPGFDPTTIIVIQQTTVIIDNFTVIDINTGETYGRPAGTDGGSDGPPPEQGAGETTTTTSPSTETTQTTATSVPPSTETTTTTSGGGGPVDSSELNGVWSGTLTITDINVPAAAAQQLQGQGCDMSALEALKNVPLPMQMTITVEAGGAGGTALMDLDVSSVAGSSASSEPQTLSFTIDGDTLTFALPASSGATGTMTGKVSRQDPTLVIDGIMTSEGEGASMKAEWQVTKQVTM
jgi:hypothetical protein